MTEIFVAYDSISIKQVLELHLQILYGVKDSIRMNRK